MKSYVPVFCESGFNEKITAAGLFLFRRCAKDYEYLLLKRVNRYDDAYWTPPQGI